MICRLGAVVVMSPVFLIPGIMMALKGIGYSERYVRAQLAVKRKSSFVSTRVRVSDEEVPGEMSILRAPVLDHLSETNGGLGEVLVRLLVELS